MKRLLPWASTHVGAAAALVVAALLVVGLGIYWFAPQNLVLDERVNEALPSSAPPASEVPAGEPPEAPAAEAETLASGGFQGLEHGTSGRAVIVELADGSRFLRLADLQTSNGPDLRVYLTDQPLSGDWHVWDDGRYVDLGALKGNVGSSNYEISADVDLDTVRTAVIWCRRFTVGFGVAPLDPS